MTFGTLNMQMKQPDEGFEDILRKCDILCLQEVTPSCVEDLLQIARSYGYEVATAMGRGSVGAEPFDVCMLLNTTTIRKLRMSVSPLTPDSPRRLLAVQIQLCDNGAVIAVGTVHLTASPEGQTQRLAELKSALSTLGALQVDGHFLVGDINMQKDEDATTTDDFWAWNDARQCAGRDPSNAGTFCPEYLDCKTDVRVEQWRFDRILFRAQDCWRESEMARQEVGRITTVKLCDKSFAVDFNAAPSDHAFVQASFAVVAGVVTEGKVLQERLQVLRPGLGPQGCRRPGAKEKCGQQRQGQIISGKDYEKARILPGAGAILEDPRRKALYRLYTRRNCHHLNMHDPLKAMGLVANVDDQVVLTCQAAVNYLTKYMGKLGGGHSGSGRIGGLIDDIVCRMRGTDTMTVSSLLSKLFIHAAVPDDICSLEAWHLLWALPRAMSSRHVTTLNAKDAIVPFNAVNIIEGGTAEDQATQTTKLGQYLQRCQVSLSSPLHTDMVGRMSMSQFFARVDRRGYRHKSCGLRVKSNIVKEKLFLQLDLRKRGVADMARQCLRLHKPFACASDDPMLLSDFDAIEQLQAFMQQPQCPVWLKRRFARHNRVKRQSAAGSQSVVAAVRSCNAGIATSQPVFLTLGDTAVSEEQNLDAQNPMVDVGFEELAALKHNLKVALRIYAALQNSRCFACRKIVTKEARRSSGLSYYKYALCADCFHALHGT